MKSTRRISRFPGAAPFSPRTGDFAPRAGCVARSTRRGLAPLEFVLCLPLLLLMMALMINYGNLALWKVRATTAARHAVWRVRGDRHGASDPSPPNWTPPAEIAAGPASPPEILPDDPFATHEVVRGPVLRDPLSRQPESQLTVDDRLLPTPRGLGRGASRRAWTFPLAPRMFGKIRFDLDHLLLDGQWQFQDMGGGDYHVNLGRNDARRFRTLYSFSPPSTVQQLVQGFRDAAMAILGASYRPDLAVLDKDQEFLAAYGPPPPDFYPGLGLACSLEPIEIRDGIVEDLIDRIQGPSGGGRRGLPESLARAFLGLYNAQLSALRAQQFADPSEIARLEDLVARLNRFIASLN
jgi:TadE-like protein